MAEKPQKLVVFRQTISALQGIQERQLIKNLKIIKTVTIHWPDGCNSLVEVAVGYGSKRLMPEEGYYIALNDATITWVVNTESDSKYLWVEIKNGDSANAHIISVIVSYEESD